MVTVAGSTTLGCDLAPAGVVINEDGGGGWTESGQSPLSRRWRHGRVRQGSRYAVLMR
jgi:hypothetical protein